ncbi:hypothetical protein PQR33_40740 [Paraburkholderia sediminicola]
MIGIIEQTTNRIAFQRSGFAKTDCRATAYGDDTVGSDAPCFIARFAGKFDRHMHGRLWKDSGALIAKQRCYVIGEMRLVRRAQY